MSDDLKPSDGTPRPDGQNAFARLNALLDEAPSDDASEEEMEAFFTQVLQEQGGEDLLKELAQAVQQGENLEGEAGKPPPTGK
jgi:hypothetical protein